MKNLSLFDTESFTSNPSTEEPNNNNGKKKQFQVDYKYITTLEEALVCLEELKQNNNPIGVDLETTTLSPHTGRIRLIQLAQSKDFSYVLDIDKIERFPKKELNELFKGRKKIAHNACFESQWLEKYGVPIRYPIFCTMLGRQILINGQSNRKISLAASVESYLEIEIDKEEQQSNWEGNLTKEQIKYAARDAALLPPLRQKILERLKDRNLIECAKLEMRAIAGFAQMEIEGLKFDWDFVESIIPELEQKLEEARKDFLEELKTKSSDNDFYIEHGLNLRSVSQLLPTMQNAGLPIKSMNKDELKQYIADYSLIDKYLHWKDLETQIKDAQKYLNHKNKVTLRAHSSFRQFGAEAGRVTSSNPNVQNLPRSTNFRKAIIPEPNRIFVCADYSQIELRIIAQIANEKKMIQAYQEGKDLHRLTASIVLSIPEEKVDKESRRIAKAINFGLIYGQGAKGFQRYAKTNYGIDLSLDKSEEFISKFFKAFPGLRNWHNEVKKQLNHSAFVYSLSGRQRFLLEEKRKLTNGANTPVQGTGADILKLAIANLIPNLDELNKEGYAKIVNCVHDEILLEVDSHIGGKAKEILEQTMIKAGEHFINEVPIVAEANLGTTWEDAK